MKDPMLDFRLLSASIGVFASLLASVAAISYAVTTYIHTPYDFLLQDRGNVSLSGVG